MKEKGKLSISRRRGRMKHKKVSDLGYLVKNGHKFV